MNVKEIRDMSNEDLQKQVTDLSNELYGLRFQQATGSLENPSHIKDVRKTIARIKTVITERANAKEETK
jgi:large subunit ribosomal protein L29